MTHWAIQYIGLPWAFGQAGPHAYDCWNFVRLVYNRHFNIDLPVVEYTADWKDSAKKLQDPEARREWRKVDKPQEGDAVMMARSRYPIHIGLWINANGTQGVLHCLERVGVHFTSQNLIRSSGWGSLEYYRHASR